MAQVPSGVRSCLQLHGRVIAFLGAGCLCLLAVTTRALWLLWVGQFLIVADLLRVADALVPWGRGHSLRLFRGVARAG
jgi:hypothetical protein